MGSVNHRRASERAGESFDQGNFAILAKGKKSADQIWGDAIVGARVWP